MKLSIAKTLAVVALAGSAAMSAPASAGVDPFVGQIQAFPYTFCPRGWVEADGRELPISENVALFSLLGTQFGGDGRTTFAVPDLSDEPIRHCIATVGIYPSRN